MTRIFVLQARNFASKFRLMQRKFVSIHRRHQNSRFTEISPLFHLKRKFAICSPKYVKIRRSSLAFHLYCITVFMIFCERKHCRKVVTLLTNASRLLSAPDPTLLASPLCRAHDSITTVARETYARPVTGTTPLASAILDCSNIYTPTGCEQVELHHHHHEMKC